MNNQIPTEEEMNAMYDYFNTCATPKELRSKSNGEIYHLAVNAVWNLDGEEKFKADLISSIVVLAERLFDSRLRNQK